MKDKMSDDGGAIEVNAMRLVWKKRIWKREVKENETNYTVMDMVMEDEVNGEPKTIQAYKDDGM